MWPRTSLPCGAPKIWQDSVAPEYITATVQRERIPVIVVQRPYRQVYIAGYTSVAMCGPFRVTQDGRQ